MLVFLLPSLIQRLSRPERGSDPTIESHTHEHDGAGCSRCLSWSPRRKLHSPLPAVFPARGGRNFSRTRFDRRALLMGLGPAEFPGNDAHDSAENQRIQREYPIESTTRIYEPFNGGTPPFMARSLNSSSGVFGRRRGRQHRANSSRSGVFLEKETD